MNSQLHALIVDDEMPGRTNLQLALAEHPRWTLVGACATVDDARTALRRGQAIDVVFLDVQMPQESGMVLARELATQNQPPIVVFVTAYQHYAVQAFDFHAIDYLLKPFDDARLATTLKRVEHLFDLRLKGAAYTDALRNYVQHASISNSATTGHYMDRICVRSVGQIETVPVCDIAWIISSGNYVELHLPARVVLHRCTFSEILDRLDPSEFMRVHRRAMVRKSRCQTLRVVGDGSYQLGLLGGDCVPVSERYVGDVRRVLLEPT